MAVVNISGAETGDSSECNATSGTFSIVSSPTISGGYCYRCNPTTTASGWVQFGDADLTAISLNGTLWARCRFRYAAKPSADDEPIIRFGGVSGTTKLEIRITSAGTLAAYDRTDTIITTGSTVLAADTTYIIAVRCDDSATGAWEVKINGVSEISGTNDLSTSDHSAVRFGKTNRNDETVDFFFDDIQLNSTAYPDNGTVARKDASADGTYTAWTIGAGAGSDWENIDDVPHDSDTTYLLSTASAGDAQTADIETNSSAGINPSTISAAKAVVAMKRTGAANGIIQVRLRSASTDSDSGDIATSSVYQGLALMAETDPATAVAWTASGLDTVEVGAEERDTDASRMSMACLMVDFVAAAAANRVWQLAPVGTDPADVAGMIHELAGTT